MRNLSGEHGAIYTAPCTPGRSDFSPSGGFRLKSEGEAEFTVRVLQELFCTCGSADAVMTGTVLSVYKLLPLLFMQIQICLGRKWTRLDRLLTTPSSSAHCVSNTLHGPNAP